jgi:hypothetical protein
VVSFTHLPLYYRGKNPRYPLDRRVRGPKIALEDVKRRKILASTGTRNRTRSHSLYRLRYPGSQSAKDDNELCFILYRTRYSVRLAFDINWLLTRHRFDILSSRTVLITEYTAIYLVRYKCTQLNRPLYLGKLLEYESEAAWLRKKWSIWNVVRWGVPQYRIQS